MKEVAYPDILDRHEFLPHLNEHFKDSLELLREVVNYGTRLIPRSFVSSDREIPDIVLASLLMHGVAMLDSVEILLSQGATLAANIPARALFEVRLYIEWILKENPKKRARQYHCWILRKERMWARRLIPGTDEYRRYYNTAKDLGVEETARMFKQKAGEQIKIIDEILSSEKYGDINAKFNDRMRNGHDRPWFSIGGPSSIADPAVRLECKGEYDIYYTKFSDVSHSQAFLKHILGGEGSIKFHKIRNLEEIGMK